MFSALFPLAISTLSPPQMNAHRVATPPVIDGKLGDRAWVDASASSDFTQTSPDEGTLPSEKTTVRIVYDDNNVYVGFECQQTSVPVVAHLTRRDRWVESDQIIISLDTRGDKKSAFEFTVNAAGSLIDGVWYDDTKFSQDWDENWEAQTTITKDGWSAEIRIPLRILRYPTAPIQTWGMQARRYISAKKESNIWSYVPKSESAEVSRYGALTNLESLPTPQSLEVKPFVVGSLSRVDSELDNSVTPKLSGGFDLKWHPTQNLTLDTTFNPDFAQVEADTVVLNLSNYETWLPEKRTFFLEGINAFETPYTLVYTRRIGSAPASPTIGENEEIIVSPEPSTILNATKLVGQLNSTWSIGMLSALTLPNRVPTYSEHQTEITRIAEPLTLFQAIRLQHQPTPQLSIGVLSTAVLRSEEISDYPTTDSKQICPDGSEINHGERCFHDAHVTGIDMLWRSPGGDYTVQSHAVTSVISNGPDRTMPDGTIVSSNDAGVGAHFKVAKTGGEHWLWGAEYWGASRKFDINDLGFMDRQNVQYLSGRVTYRTLKPWWETRSTSTSLRVFEAENLDWLLIDQGIKLDSSWTFKNYWNANVGIQYTPQYFDDREVGDGTALERPANVGPSLSINTDSRKNLHGGIWSNGRIRENGWSINSGIWGSVRPISPLEISVEPSFSMITRDTQWLETENDVYHFANLNAQTASLTLRSTYTLTPQWTLQTYLQGFLAAGHYFDFTAAEVSTGNIVHLSHLRPASLTSDETYDFSTGTLNANIVLRWEYRLGSVLYLVYSHAQETESELRSTDQGVLDWKLLEPHWANDILLAKLSYWWGM